MTFSRTPRNAVLVGRRTANDVQNDINAAVALRAEYYEQGDWANVDRAQLYIDALRDELATYADPAKNAHLPADKCTRCVDGWSKNYAGVCACCSGTGKAGARGLYFAR